MIYRIHYNDDQDGSSGYAYAGSWKEAMQCRKEWVKESPEFRQGSDIEGLPLPKNKEQLLDLLRMWGSHHDNG
jgi:predicted S18 family serine protease